MRQEVNLMLKIASGYTNAIALQVLISVIAYILIEGF